MYTRCIKAYTFGPSITRWNRTMESPRARDGRGMSPHHLMEDDPGTRVAVKKDGGLGDIELTTKILRGGQHHEDEERKQEDREVG